MPIFGIRVGVHHHVGSFCIPAASLSGEKERQGFQMRKFKTAADNRTNYIYYFDDGSKCVITNGGQADVYVIFAMTDKAKGNKGISYPLFEVFSGLPV